MSSSSLAAAAVTVVRKSPLPNDNNNQKPKQIPSFVHPTLNYMHHPHEMITAFRECEEDPECHIMFHHAYKTGGTTIEYNMRKLFNETKILSCCEERMMHKFDKHPGLHCGRKFSGYQVGWLDFLKVVRHCQHAKVLILTSFRDPVSLMVSWIHQMCNKLDGKRSPEVLSACRSCNYNDGNATHAAVWKSMADETLRQLQNVHRVAQFPQRIQNWNRLEPLGYKPKQWPRVNTTRDYVKVFTLELSDVSDFFTQWHPHFPYPQPRNPEDLHTCNFYTPSALIKYLRPAQEWYRQLVASG